MAHISTTSSPPVAEGTMDANADYRPPPGYLGNLSIPQQHALEKLKKELEVAEEEEEWFVFDKERLDDLTLLRFLRARKFDVPKTKEMLLSAEQWRKEFKVANIVESFSFPEKEQVNQYYPQYYHKTDVEGRPVYIEELGQLDVKRLYTITTQERLLQRLVWEYEKSLTYRLPACSKSTGRPVETFCTIMNLYNVSLTSFYKVKDYVMAAASIGQNRYPETMGKFYIINAPWAFSAVWSVIKPWLDEVTVKKIVILGGNYQEELAKQIGKENLPKELGGSCECRGKGGCKMSDAGPWN